MVRLRAQEALLGAPFLLSWIIWTPRPILPAHPSSIEVCLRGCGRRRVWGWIGLVRSTGLFGAVDRPNRVLWSQSVDRTDRGAGRRLCWLPGGGRNPLAAIADEETARPCIGAHELSRAAARRQRRLVSFVRTSLLNRIVNSILCLDRTKACALIESIGSTGAVLFQG